jgi:ADP-heptose:LPS heptosyltransferase
LPIFNALRMTYPEASISYLTNLPMSSVAVPSAELLAGGGLVDDVISYPLGLRAVGPIGRLWRRLWGEKYDLIVNISGSRGRFCAVRDWLFFSSLAPGRVFGTPGILQRDAPVYLADKGLYQGEGERLLTRLKPLGLSLPNMNERGFWNLHLSAAELKKATEVQAALGAGQFLVMSIGTKADTNDWGDTAWKECLSLISASMAGWGLVIIGAAAERQRSEGLAAVWEGPTLVLAGVTTPRESAAVLARASLFVGHDSGPMHLAATVGTPCVVVFSARNRPGLWFPAGGIHTIFYHQTPCFGCGLEECPVYDKKCIRAIKPVLVANEVIGRLQQRLSIAPGPGNVWIDPAKVALEDRNAG